MSLESGCKGHADQDGGPDCASCSTDCLPIGRGGSVQRAICCHFRANKPVTLGFLVSPSPVEGHRGNRMKKIGEVSYFFGWRATSGLLNRCFWGPESNSRDALGCLRVLIGFDNQMGRVYHRFQEQKCSRSVHYELIWKISDLIS